MQQEDNLQFTLANLPLGIARRKGTGLTAGIVTRLYGFVYFISTLQSKDLLQRFDAEIEEALQKNTLNDLAALGVARHRQLREALREVFTVSTDEELSPCRVLKNEVEMMLPVKIGDFSDFSCSLNHVLNAGEAVMGVRSIPPGFLHFPIGYGGRSSSIMVSGRDVIRPHGHFKDNGEVIFGPSRAVDFELEVACVVGKPTTGQPVTADNAEEHIFGFILLNDWSARDIQGLEMPPLGPFNGKSFGTTISPWIIMADALRPFLLPVPQRQKATADHFSKQGDLAHYGVNLTATINASESSTIVCNSRLDWIYWTMNDMIAHQTSNGCTIVAGDLLATGTVSGTEKGSHACLLEITKGGKESLTLSNGSQRTYLHDGDTVILGGWAGELGSENCVGFGNCFGTLQPAT